VVQLYRHHLPLGKLCLTLTETSNSKPEELEMRMVFTATLSVDVDAYDDKLRAAFIKLMTMNVRNMSAPAAMLAHKRPTLSLKMTSRNGVEDLPIFEAENVDANSGE
jgi:hypothetical protein